MVTVSFVGGIAMGNRDLLSAAQRAQSAWSNSVKKQLMRMEWRMFLLQK